MTAKSTTKRLVLLDAHAIIHRAYHALPDFSSSKGEPTGALFGISSMLLSIIKDLNPDYIAACFDLPDPTHRHEVFEDYKAGRKKTDDELVAQLERSRELFSAFGIPIYEHTSFEADDALGTIVEQLKDKKDIDIIIASGDMDTLQLVDNKKVQVYTLRKGLKDIVLYDEDAVVERFKFGSDSLPDYKGLRGDPSDNIPGIAGVGDKIATDLVSEFGTLEKIYEALEKSEEKFLAQGFKPRVVKLLREGKDEAFFSKMLATIRRDVPITYELPKKVWRDSLNIQEILTMFGELEFRTLGERLKSMLGVEEDEEETKEQQAIDEHDLKATAIALWVLRSDITNPGLEDVLQFANTEDFTTAKKAIFETLKDRKLDNVYETIEKPLIPVVTKMDETGVLLDVAYLKKLSKEYHKELSGYEKAIYKYAGTTFNIKSPKQLAEILFDKLQLKPKNQKKTSTGQRSTKESELEKMRDDHPIIQEIFDYRELQKLLSTYIDALPKLVGDDNRLHAEFLQAGAATGRMASQNPGLQNIPIRTEHGRLVRNAFIAESGFSIVALDYSQIELRIASILSKDTKLMNVFKDGGDVHTAVAADVFGVTDDKVTKDMRRKAKVINFGILYGMGVNALRQNLGDDTTLKEARAFYDAYFKTYDGLAQWLDHTKADAARLGYTETLFGRRRYFEGINSKLPFIRAAAERMAINAPVQGTSADVIKIAMVQIDEFLQKGRLEDDARLVLQVHDELVYEIRSTKVKDIAPKIETIMESVLSAKQTHGVPLSVDVQVGNNWGEMKKISH